VAVGPEYRERLLLAFERAHPQLKREQIPAQVRMALMDRPGELPSKLRAELERSWSYPELFGPIEGRFWQVSPLFAGEAFDPTFREVPVLTMRALYRPAPPGREREHPFPWLYFGAPPSRWARFPDWTSVSETQLIAARVRRRRFPADLSSSGGRRLVAEASERTLASQLREPSTLEEYGRWERLVGPSSWRGRPIPPLLTANPPWMSLYLGVRPGLAPEQLLEVPVRLNRIIERLESATGAPNGRELPIETESRTMPDGYRHPVPEPLYRCPHCGRSSRTLRAANAARIPVNLVTVCCQEPLFSAELPA
jgi:hypothetical protein